MGPLYLLYRKKPYKPIGPQPNELIDIGTLEDASKVLKKHKNLPLLKQDLWHGIDNRIRPKAWKVLFKYSPFKESL